MKTLFVKYGSVGDSILSLPAMRAAKALYPGSEFDLYAVQEVSNVALALGMVDHAYYPPSQDPNTWPYDKLVYLHAFRNTWGMDPSRFIRTNPLDQLGPFMALQYLDALVPGSPREGNLLGCPAGDNGRTALLVGVSVNGRQWFEWRALALELAKTDGSFVVCGYNFRAPLARQLASILQCPAVTTNLADIGKEVAQCRNFIGLEAAMTHLAWGMGKRGIALLRKGIQPCLVPPGCAVIPLEFGSADLVFNTWKGLAT
jgi:hypothetical protein